MTRFSAAFAASTGGISATHSGFCVQIHLFCRRIRLQTILQFADSRHRWHWNTNEPFRKLTLPINNSRPLI
jgi:hypothetical protein